MNGETNLKTLVAEMQPILHEEPYIFCLIGQETFENLPFQPLCTFHEPEGITVISTQRQADEYNLTYEGTWAWITLSVYSSLNAIGFLAAITERLARAGISVNAVSAFSHDHLLIPWESGSRALDELIQWVRSACV